MKIGVKIDKERLEEIRNKQKTAQGTLRGFLRILNYYKEFLTDLAQKAAPLYELLRKGVRWIWKETRQKAFEELKNSFYSNLTQILFYEQMPQI